MKKKGFTPKNEYISVDDCNKDYSKSTGFARYEKYLHKNLNLVNQFVQTKRIAFIFSVIFEAENWTMAEIASKLNYVQKGGEHSPLHCKPK
jgi:hypothetical protein